MTLAIHGLVVSRGIAIGRAVLAASSHLDVSHYYITPEPVSYTHLTLPTILLV